MADGGVTQQPTYPFGTNTQSTTPTDSNQSGTVSQTFNMSPTAQAGQPDQQQTFKKGGKVSSASKRADGCAIRGKTRA